MASASPQTSLIDAFEGMSKEDARTLIACRFARTVICVTLVAAIAEGFRDAKFPTIFWIMWGIVACGYGVALFAWNATCSGNSNDVARKLVVCLAAWCALEGILIEVYVGVLYEPYAGGYYFGYVEGAVVLAVQLITSWRLVQKAA